MAERRRLVAHGNVQGVFFRDSTRREAERLGVSGWAENLADGTVEVVIEGDRAAVDAMVEFVQNGPGHSTVSALDESVEAPSGLSGFSSR
jgi:acylphosphatase